MIEAEYYSIIFRILIAVLAYKQFILMTFANGKSYYSSNDIRLITFLIVLALFIGTRPLSWAFADMFRYAWGYSECVTNWHNGTVFQNLSNPTEICLLLVALFSSMFSDGLTVYFSVISFGYVFCIYFALRKLNIQERYLGMLYMLSTLSFFNMGVNVIRNGLAASITLFAFAVLLDEKKSKWGYFLCLLAMATHTSMILPISIFLLLLRFEISLNNSLLIWVACIFISLLIGNKLANFMNGIDIVADRFEGYVTEESERYKIGFRWDFLIYSAIPMATSYFLYRRYNLQDESFLMIFKTYILANSFWILVIRMAFTDRMAYLSWFMYGLLLFYPTTLLPTKTLRKYWGGLLLGMAITIRISL